jgi:O-antigen/teichoic acid export membrane protein
MLKSVVHNVGALSAGQLSNVIGNLLLVPLLLSRWSTPVYGEWTALSALVAYLGTLDLGMNSAAANALLASHTQRDASRYAALQATAAAFYISVACVITLLAGALCLLLPLPKWLGIVHIPGHDATMVLWILAARMIWQLPACYVWSVFRTAGNLAASQWFGNAHALGGVAVTAAVVFLQGSCIQVAVWGALPLAISTGVAWLCVRKYHRDLLPDLRNATPAALTQLLRPSLYFGLIMLAMAVGLNGPVLIISKTLGGDAVALLVTTRVLVSMVRQVVGVVSNAVWPELTKLEATGGHATLRTVHSLLSALCVALSVTFATALWFEGHSVITVWTAGRLTNNMPLLRLYLAVVALQAPWLASSMIPTATNRHKRLAYSYAIAAAIGVAATAILVPHIGVVAVPAGILVGEVAACYHYVVRDACKSIGEPYWAFAKHTWRGVAIASVLALSASWIGHVVTPGPPPCRWAVVGALAGIAAFFATWCVMLRSEERRLIVGWMTSKLTGLKDMWITVSPSA